MTQKLVLAPSGTTTDNIPRFSTTTGQIEDSGLDANGLGDAAASQTQMEAATAVNVYVSPGRQHYHPGHIKTWFYYDQTTPALNSSYNVTSVTDTSAGLFTVNFSITYSNSNSCGGTASLTASIIDPIATNIGTTSATFNTTNLSATLTDAQSCGALFGDI